MNNNEAYWRENVRLVLILLGIVFVDQLNGIRLGGYKLGFWIAQQGSIYMFVVLTFLYGHLVGKLDKKYGVEEG